MLRYIIRRLLQAIPTVLLVRLLVFLMLQLIPGDPAEIYLGERQNSPEQLEIVREQMGLTNVWVMVPFVRTLGEARKVTELLAANGLGRGQNGLKLVMMCELPTNAVLADQYLEFFDGMSIGSNDMTQLTLGVDRDSSIVAKLFDERDPAVKAMLSMAIAACRKAGKYVGICGQGPSDHPDLAQWLLEQGIESISLNPDSVVETWIALAGNRPG